jgi:hypothetical protein
MRVICEQNEEKARFAAEDLSGLRPAVHLAKKMGTELGIGPLLQRTLPPQQIVFRMSYNYC